MSTADLIEPRALSHEEIIGALSHPDALWEIEYGRIVEKRMSALAIAVSNRLMEMIAADCRRLALGCWYLEMVFVLDSAKNLRRRPDLAFVSVARWPLDKPQPYRGDWAIAPNIAVEVVSPGNFADELARKRREYFRYGVEEVWIIYPEERLLEVYDSHGSHEFTHQDRLTSRLLPGIEIELLPFLPLVEPTAP